jgi:hypothetical protein
MNWHDLKRNVLRYISALLQNVLEEYLNVYIFTSFIMHIGIYKIFRLLISLQDLIIIHGYFETDALCRA